MLFGPWRKKRLAPRSAPRTTSWRPRLESLEDRTVPATLFVGPNGSDSPGFGLSPQTPLRNIQQAINSANSGDTILVAGGTYTYQPAEDTLCTPFLHRTGVACVINKQLTITGGFSTTNFSAPNPTANPTVIDGQGGVRGMYVVSTGSATAVNLSGFTIQNGFARGTPNPMLPPDEQTFGFGGGMLVDVANVNISNTVFKNNAVIGENLAQPDGGSASGGGLAIRQSTANLSNLTFTGNFAMAGSGATRGGFAIGGGLFTFQSPVNGSNLTFTNNAVIAGPTQGAGFDGGMLADGQGGAFAAGVGSTVTLDGVVATGNTAVGGNSPNGQAGGAFAGGLYAELATLVVRNARVQGNLAQGGNGVNNLANQLPAGLAEGGGISTINSNVTIDRTFILDNTAVGGQGTTFRTSAGGGGAALVRLQGNTGTVIVNTIVGNNHANMGGGNSDILGGGGGGLFLQGLNGSLTHVTIAGNTLNDPAMQGLGALLITAPTGTPSVINLAFSIIANHTGQDIAALQVQQPDTVNLGTVLFAGNTKDTNAGAGAPQPAGTFNGLNSVLTAASAGFVNPAQSNYKLAPGSPAIDKAGGSTTPVDIDNQARAGTPDLGADELDAQVAPPPPTNPKATTIGVFDPTTATWFLRNSNSTGGPDFPPFQFGAPGWIPVVGDWDGNGTVTIGVFDPTTATWFLRNSNTPGGADIQFAYGAPGWTPVAGDFDGDGRTDIGVFDPFTATWYLTAGGKQLTPFAFGLPGTVPVVGDFDGDGRAGVGIYNPFFGTWFLTDSGKQVAPVFAYGAPGWVPVIGDWDGNGTQTIGVFDPTTANFYLRNQNNGGSPDIGPFAFGGGFWKPVAGDWNGPGA